MSEPKRSTEELLKRMSEYNRISPPEKLESDEQGRLLLNPENPHHVDWYFDDEIYEPPAKPKK